MKLAPGAAAAAGIASVLFLAGCGNSSGQSVGYSNGHAAAVQFVSDTAFQQAQIAASGSIADTGTVQGGVMAIAMAYNADNDAYGPIDLPTSVFGTARLLCSDAQLQGNDPLSASYNTDWNNGCIAGLEGH